MTWAKYGVEFFDELADLGLTDAAVRTHAEAIGYVYRTENTNLRIPVRSLRRFAGSPDCELAAKELVTSGCWREDGDVYVIVHHADVIRQSLAAQQAKRDDDRMRQRRKRARDKAVTADVGSDVTRDVRATQTDRHTPKSAGLGGRVRGSKPRSAPTPGKARCPHGKPRAANDGGGCNQCVMDEAAERAAS